MYSVLPEVGVANLTALDSQRTAYPAKRVHDAPLRTGSGTVERGSWGGSSGASCSTVHGPTHASEGSGPGLCLSKELTPKFVSPPDRRQLGSSDGGDVVKNRSAAPSACCRHRRPAGVRARPRPRPFPFAFCRLRRRRRGQRETAEESGSGARGPSNAGWARIDSPRPAKKWSQKRGV